jgi:uncharacterized protein (TIGR00725 family)
VAINSSPAEPVPAAPLTIAVIGSARIEPPDPRCALADRTGAAIAARGWITLTGGYGGLMGVVSRAAAGAGGKVAGLPMRGWTHLTPNQWCDELRWSDTYPERFAHLLAADAMIALDGGIGTLAEAAIAWASLQTEQDTPGLVFLGEGWAPVLDAIAGHLVIDDRDMAHVKVCTDPDEAMAHIAATAGRRPHATQARG